MKNRATRAQRFFDGATTALTVFILLGAVLRLHDLDRTGLWFDESVSWRDASLPLLEMVKAVARDTYPPLHNVFLHFVIRWFGDSETALRAPSALIGLFNIYVMYRIGEAFWDRKTGLLAAFLLTISGVHIWYSTDGRMYALFALAASVYVWTAVELLRRPSGWWLAGNLLSGIALLYSHVFGMAIFCSLNTFAVLLYRRQAIQAHFPWKGWLLTQMVAGISFLPWAKVILDKFNEVKLDFWIPEPTAYQVLGELSVLLGGPLPAVVTCLLAGLALFGGKSAGRMPGTFQKPERAAMFMTAWLLSSVVFALLVSLISFPVFLSRYLLGGLPAVYLLAARGLALLDHHGAKAKIALAITFVLLAFPVWRYAYLQPTPGADARSAVSVLRQSRKPGEPLFRHRDPYWLVFEYHARNDPETVGSVRELELLDDGPPPDDRYWVLAYYRKSTKLLTWQDIALKALGAKVYWSYTSQSDSLDLDPLLETHAISAAYEFNGVRLFQFVRRRMEQVKMQ